MRAGSLKREPEILAEWEKIGLEQRIRSDRKGKEKIHSSRWASLC